MQTNQTKRSAQQRRERLAASRKLRSFAAADAKRLIADLRKRIEVAQGLPPDCDEYKRAAEDMSERLTPFIGGLTIESDLGYGAVMHYDYDCDSWLDIYTPFDDALLVAAEITYYGTAITVSVERQEDELHLLLCDMVRLAGSVESA